MSDLDERVPATLSFYNNLSGFTEIFPPKGMSRCPLPKILLTSPNWMRGGKESCLCRFLLYGSVILYTIAQTKGIVPFAGLLEVSETSRDSHWNLHCLGSDCFARSSPNIVSFL